MKITEHLGVKIPDKYADNIDLARSFAIGSRASQERKGIEEFLKPFKEMEIKAVFQGVDIPEYEAFREGFGGRRVILTEEALSTLKNAERNARYNIEPLFLKKKSTRDKKQEILDNLRNSKGYLPVDIERFSSPWQDKELIFCTYDDGKKSLFSRFNEGSIIRLELSDDLDLMKEHGKTAPFYESILGIVGARDPVGDIALFEQVLDLNSVATYRRLASLGRNFTFLDYLQSVSKREVTGVITLDSGKSANEYQDMVDIFNLTRLNSGSKIFDSSFNETRGPFVPVNTAAAIIASCKMRSRDYSAA